MMELVWGSTGPLVMGGLGLFLLFQLRQRLRRRASVKDSVVVITGASSGLGKECARVFHTAGARLILCGRNETKLQEVVHELTETGVKQQKMRVPRIVTFNLSDTEAVARASEEILKCYGHVDILINNAGVSYRGNILDTPISIQKEAMETNYFGPMALTQALLPSMVHRRSGHVVAISSVQGKISIPYRSAYAASKHAMQAYFDCLRAEVDQYNIQVMVFSPGYIRTNLSFNALTADGSKHGVLDRNTQMGRDPRDVALELLHSVEHGKKDVLTAGLVPALAVYVRTLWPALFFRLMASRARKEYKPKEE